MAIVRVYSILPPKVVTYASQKRVCTLHRDAFGDSVHEEYPIMPREQMLTQIREFLRVRGERIIGVTGDEVVTEVVDDVVPVRHDTRSVSAIEEEYRAAGMGQD